MTYHVEDGRIYNDAKELGHVGEILVDTRQQEHAIEIVAPARLKTIPYGDYLFVTPSGHIVCLEEKRQGDLDTSWRSRKVQRQLREAHEANPDGINGLVLRLQSSILVGDEGGTYSVQRNEILLDLTKLQLLGIPVVMVPARGIVPHLVALRAIIQPGVHLLSPLAGTDKRKVREKMTPVALALREAVDGVGYKLATEWAAASHQDILVAFGLDEEEMKAIGLPSPVRKRVKVLRENN